MSSAQHTYIFILGWLFAIRREVGGGLHIHGVCSSKWQSKAATRPQGETDGYKECGRKEAQGNEPVAAGASASTDGGGSQESGKQKKTKTALNEGPGCMPKVITATASATGSMSIGTGDHAESEQETWQEAEWQRMQQQEAAETPVFVAQSRLYSTRSSQDQTIQRQVAHSTKPAESAVSRKSTTGLVAQIGNHNDKSGSTLQSLTALSVGEAEFLRSGERRSSWTVPEQSESSTSNSLTDRLGARQRMKHIDTRYSWIQEQVQDVDLSIKKVLTAKKCAGVGTKPVFV